MAVLVTMATMAALLTAGTVPASRRGGSDQN